ncbi:hypothetical protein LRB26_05605, partial [Borreliella burgdorferi]|nr:hypothetical protein [Borreliella burgdorferi]MCD2388957.1 hypothetical protein [Borreliella burgdorferi]MCD2398636.1 hypothetical protein [Borreliella burgdorferi]
DEHKSQFEKLNETNRNSLKQMAEKAQDTTKSLYDSMLDSLNAFMKDMTGKFLNKDTGESIGEEFHNLINGEDVNVGEALEKMSTQMYESWK